MSLTLYKRLASDKLAMIPEITIGSHGDIILNRALMENVGSWPWVHLYFEDAKQMLLIKFTQDADGNTLRLKRYKDAGAAKISGMGFCRCFKIPMGERRVYKAHYKSDQRCAWCIIDKAEVAA